MEWTKLRWLDEKLIPHYEISRTGIIRCTLGDDMEILYKQKSSHKGNKPKPYWFALIRKESCDKWLAVHRLMCYSWLGSFPHPLRYICDHIDGDSTNNHLWNFRYLTIRGNNLNRKGVKGVVLVDGKWCPRIAGFVHKKYGHEDMAFAKELRSIMLQSYIRYTSYYPNSDGYPHRLITRF